MPIDKLPALTRNAALLYNYLRAQAGASGAVLCGLDVLSKALTVDRRTVQRAAAALDNTGLAVSVPLGDLRLYIIDPARVSREQLAQGVLETRVLLSPDEQAAVEAALDLADRTAEEA